MRRLRSTCAALMALMAASLPTGAPEAVEPPAELDRHLAAIAALARPAPAAAVPPGWFIMGTNRKDDDPYGLSTQYDDTELPQRRVWLDAFVMDRDEVSIAEYLAFVLREQRTAPEELQRVIWHVITVHSVPDYVIASWPVIYVTWPEAAEFCSARGKRLPSEAEWEKAARGTDGRLFPWGERRPEPGLAVFGQYHVHEIPLMAAVSSGEEGQSPYGLRNMAGNVAEWVQDWFMFDYYAIMTDRNPRGPASGRYKSVRGGSWKSRPNLLRAATRNGSSPERRLSTIGFRCAGAGS